MELSKDTIDKFKEHCKTLLQKINDKSVKDTLGKSQKRFGVRSTIMFLVMKHPTTAGHIISAGHISRAGSYIPAYNKYTEVSNYIKDEMSDSFASLHDEYVSKYPKRKVLYLRYNLKRDILEMFSSGNCVLTSRIFSDSD